VTQDGADNINQLKQKISAAMNAPVLLRLNLLEPILNIAIKIIEDHAREIDKLRERIFILEGEGDDDNVR